MSTNISKQKRDDLVNKIKAIRTYIASGYQNENTGNLLTYLSELEKEVKAKKYGLVFEEHLEAVDELLETHVPVLAEEKELFIDNGGQVNFLIEGDNLAALRLLEKTHRGRIDFIYIDPPYNTGGTDFRYDDTIVAKEDGFRHSKWISFMQKRLDIARKLLTEDGLIFISIDDNELATLKLLCDSIFGEDNRVETIVWKSKYGAGAKTVGFISVHEYVLCYSKNPIKNLTSELDEEGQQKYNKKDSKFDQRGGYLTQPLMTTSLGDRPNLVYDIEYNGDVIHPRKQWVWSRERLEEAIANDEVVFSRQKDGSYSVRAKKYLYDEQGNIRRGKPLSVMVRPLTQDGTEEIRHIFGSEDTFKFSKPSELIRFFITLEVNDKPNKSFTILDFFAGSGTTGEAVMKANVKDKGERRFILCTNNENDICRNVTYQRIKKSSEELKSKSSLKYYRIEFVPITERLYYEYADELLLHICELVELENGVNFIGNTEIAIVLTDDEMEKFVANIAEFKKCRKLYVGHNVLPTGEQQDALKKAHIEVNVIPNYYYNELEV
ncbi:MAG: site-specific DNA-methyltransferase [Bacillota bacterium]